MITFVRIKQLKTATQMTRKLFMLALVITLFASCRMGAKRTETTEKQEITMENNAKKLPAAEAEVLVLVAHPDFAGSRMNAALAAAAAEVEGVEVVNIYDYPVTADTYRNAVSRVRAIVYQFPFYWMSAPHLLKQWTDEVFMTFVQEGSIAGKEMLVVTTTGSEKAAYRHDGRNKYTMEEYLRPYEGQANHAKMHWNAPIVVYGNPQDAAAAAADLENGCKEYKKQLKAMVERLSKGQK